jgi:hypothetical protein
MGGDLHHEQKGGFAMRSPKVIAGGKRARAPFDPDLTVRHAPNAPDHPGTDQPLGRRGRGNRPKDHMRAVALLSKYGLAKVKHGRPVVGFARLCRKALHFARPQVSSA